MDSDLSTASSKKRCNPDKGTSECPTDQYCSFLYTPIEVTKAHETGTVAEVKYGVCCSKEALGHFA